MTTEKMPDEMYVTFELPGAVYRYTRAKPVEELLKQARDVLADYKKTYMELAIKDTITAIDKFLGEK